jgi:hypothetical protein
MEGTGEGGPGTWIFVLFIIFLVLFGIFTDQFKVFFALLIVFFFGRWLYKHFTEKE